MEQLKIEQGQIHDLTAIIDIYKAGKLELERNGIHQWIDTYPTTAIIEDDIKKGFLYVLKNGDQVIGAINLSEEQEKQYQTVDWQFDHSNVLVIHRLVIDPTFQKQGYGKKLMDFAEQFAFENNYASIRLDAYSQNKKVIEFYKIRNYSIRGEVNFPNRPFLFYCFEKEISHR